MWHFPTYQVPVLLGSRPFQQTFNYNTNFIQQPKKDNPDIRFLRTCARRRREHLHRHLSPCLRGQPDQDPPGSATRPEGVAELAPARSPRARPVVKTAALSKRIFLPGAILTRAVTSGWIVCDVSGAWHADIFFPLMHRVKTNGDWKRYFDRGGDKRKDRLRCIWSVAC